MGMSPIEAALYVITRGMQWPGWNCVSLSPHPLMKSSVEGAKRR